jgi:hypothetical protein
MNGYNNEEKERERERNDVPGCLKMREGMDEEKKMEESKPHGFFKSKFEIPPALERNFRHQLTAARANPFNPKMAISSRTSPNTNNKMAYTIAFYCVYKNK